MYLDYWGLQSAPFLNAPDKDLFFQSPQHEEALNRLLYAVQYCKGGAMISGEVGCGKTTLVRSMINFLPEGRFEIHIVSNPALDPLDLIRAITLKLGGNPDGDSKTVLLDRLQHQLMSRAQQRIETVVAIDEAHVITDQAALDELRMLLNMQTEKQFLVTLVLVGQPPLFGKISRLHPLNERIGMRIQIPPLDLANTAKYILYRLRSVGAERSLFSREAVCAVYKLSGGIPLRINNICDRSLLIGLMDKCRLVTEKVVNKAVADLGYLNRLGIN